MGEETASFGFTSSLAYGYAHSYQVIFTVRSAEKGSQVVEAYPDAGERLSFVVVEDMTQADAYDEVSQLTHPLTFSPFFRRSARRRG